MANHFDHLTQTYPVEAVLLDIDGTLLVESSDHISALVKVLSERLGRILPWEMKGERPHLDGIDMSGYVDSQVVRALLPADTTEEDLAQVVAEYATQFSDGIRAEHFSAGQAIPGVHEMLTTLVAHEVQLGLCTGNAASIAHLKLSNHDLHSYFTFAPNLGFGDIHMDRGVAARAAVAALEVAPRAVMLVGDTAGDMRASLAAGVTGVGVLTGAAGESELVAAGAQHVLSSVAELTRLIGLQSH